MGAVGTRILENNDKNKKLFENMCRIQCTSEEIAGIFEVSLSTLKRFVKDVYNQPFEKVYKIYASGGRASLRRYQFAQAEKNPIMAIWLGKQYLGQRDNAEVHLIENADEPDPLSLALQNSLKKTAKSKKKKVIIDMETDDDLESDD